MNYFSEMPQITYNAQGAVNITTQFQMDQNFMDNPLNFMSYYIRDGERPDIVSNTVYGSVDFTWTILYINNIHDLYTDWPLSNDEFNAYITKKYNGVHNAKVQIKNYLYLEFSAIPPHNIIREHNIDVSYYNKLKTEDPNQVSTINYNDYEFNLNENKRNIKLIRPVLIDSWEKETKNNFKI